MFGRALTFLVISLVAGMAPLVGQAAPMASPAKVKGRIIAARIEGQVSAISTLDGTIRKLQTGDEISDETEVETAGGSNAILVFSNGASVNLAAESKLNIEEFIQDPFSDQLKFSDLKREPSTSVTRLNIVEGEIVGKVVHLNVDKGSEFTVKTAVGAAGIRGTTFRIVFRPNLKTGKAFFVVTTTEGTVVFKGVTASAVSIPAGRTVTATFDYTAPTVANPQGTVANTPVTITTTAVTSAETSQVQAAAQVIQAAVVDTVVTPPTTPAGSVISQHDAADNSSATTTTPTATTTVAPVVQPVSPTVVSPSS
jgi:hypothetical protein